MNLRLTLTCLIISGIKDLLVKQLGYVCFTEGFLTLFFILLTLLYAYTFKLLFIRVFLLFLVFAYIFRDSVIKFPLTGFIMTRGFYLYFVTVLSITVVVVEYVLDFLRLKILKKSLTFLDND